VVQRYLGLGVSEEVIKRLKSPWILHLATHGFFIHYWGTRHDDIAQGREKRGTDLVVLSTCEMGVGEVSQGDRGFELCRAFQLAGVRTVIMGLWPIPISETVAIMAGFYRILRAATRAAQAPCDAALTRLRARRQLTGAAHPVFWGAFAAFGSPG
jgi:CHAT domain-containing protein